MSSKPQNLRYSAIETSIGMMYIVAEGDKLMRIYLPLEGMPEYITGIAPVKDPMKDQALSVAAKHLKDYFDGKAVPVEEILAFLPAGDDFYTRVYRECSRIPFGSTISYGALARRVGHPNAARAVGTAMAKNRLPILVPCHRVVTSDGKMGGYGGGEDTKRFLLRHEGVMV